MVFHPSHRPLEIAARFPQFHSPDDDDSLLRTRNTRGTLLSSYRGGHFYWALTVGLEYLDPPLLDSQTWRLTNPVEPLDFPES